ncbi:CidA/LrgA family protein [Moraxella sp.]|uniref:CidA/LrgA family protein n=1 Tax=Moraxella sp. TaxID=479 RepID=UPI0026DD958B|nr:CidA/LrgA family protein [Moraxella sp.]MDO4895629.1 CidA/LrgA family protein [Moraxella sp.]
MVLKAILIVFGCLFIGQVLVEWLALPLPPSVIGLLLLFAALQSGLVKLSTMEKLAKVLLDYLVLLVVPACISIMQYLDVIRDDFWVLLVGTAVSTVLVLIGTAWSYQGLRILQKRTNVPANKNQKG